MGYPGFDVSPVSNARPGAPKVCCSGAKGKSKNTCRSFDCVALCATSLRMTTISEREEVEGGSAGALPPSYVDHGSLEAPVLLEEELGGELELAGAVEDGVGAVRGAEGAGGLVGDKRRDAAPER